MTGVYDIKVVSQGNTNSKIVKKTLNTNNEVGNIIYNHLKKKSHRVTFNKCITSTCKLPILGKHIVPGKLLSGRGNYASPLLQGPTLGNTPRLDRLDANSATALLIACETLIHRLKLFHKKNGYLFGDWTLHNIVWCNKTGNLVNIDLEGFYTYSPWGPQLSWQGNESKLHSCINRLRSVVKHLLPIIYGCTLKKSVLTMTLIELPQSQLLVPFSVKTSFTWLQNHCLIIQLLPVSFTTQESQRIYVRISNPERLKGPPRFLLTEGPFNDKEVTGKYSFSFPLIKKDPNYSNFPQLQYQHRMQGKFTRFDLSSKIMPNQINGNIRVKSVVPCREIYSLLSSKI
jgi:hypothetical protein